MHKHEAEEDEAEQNEDSDVKTWDANISKQQGGASHYSSSIIMF